MPAVETRSRLVNLALEILPQLLLGLIGNGGRGSPTPSCRSRGVKGKVWVGSVGGIIGPLHGGLKEGGLLLPGGEGDTGSREEEGGGEDGEEEEEEREVEKPRHGCVTCYRCAVGCWVGVGWVRGTMG